MGWVDLATDGLGECRSLIRSLPVLSGTVPDRVSFAALPASFFAGCALGSSQRFANGTDQTELRYRARHCGHRVNDPHLDQQWRVDSQLGAELAGVVSGRDGGKNTETGKPMTSELTLTANGAQHAIPAAPETPLLYVLRNELQLRGPHFGCGLAQCGACAVLVDGKEVRSCITPVSSVAGKTVITIEGLAATWATGKVLEYGRCSQNFAPGAASLDRRAGSAVRLLPKRDDDCGSAIVSPGTHIRPWPK